MPKLRALTWAECLEIAAEVAKNIHGTCEIDAHTVRAIEDRRDFTASHPVHQQIDAEIQRILKPRRKAK